MKNRTPFKMGLIVLSIWTYSLIWVAVIVYCFKNVENVETDNWNEQKIFLVIFILIHVLIPFIIISILYYFIRRHVEVMRESARSSGGAPSAIEIEMAGREKRFTNSLMIMNVFLFVIWVLFLLLIPLYYKCMLMMIHGINLCSAVSCVCNTLYFHYNNKMIGMRVRNLLKQCCISRSSLNNSGSEVENPTNPQEINETEL